MRQGGIAFPIAACLALCFPTFSSAQSDVPDVQATVCYINGRGPYPINSCICQGTCRMPSTGGYTQYSGAAAAQAERTREQQARLKAEALKLKAAERIEEIAQKRHEAELEKARQAWLAAVRSAARDLKDVSHDSTGLKSVGGENSPTFGLKGISPDEAAETIDTASHDILSRPLRTASRRLTCAADISHYLIQHVSRLISDSATTADMDEIQYLASQASNAMMGNSVGVKCHSTDAFRFPHTSDMNKLAADYKAATHRLVRDSQSLYDAQRDAAAARWKVSRAKQDLAYANKEQLAVFVSHSGPLQMSAPPASSDNDPSVRSAYEEQKAWQKKDQAKIAMVYQKQRQLQERRRLDAMAVFKASQEEHQATTEQIARTRELTQAVEHVLRLQSGVLPQN